MGRNAEGRQLIELGTIQASGSYRGLHQALRAYWLTALTTPQISFNIRVGGTPHFVNLPFVFPVALEGFSLSRLSRPVCHGQKVDD